MGVSPMKKKYIAPAVEIEQLDMADGILLYASDESNRILGNGGKTKTDDYTVTSSDTKESGNWSSIWDE